MTTHQADMLEVDRTDLLAVLHMRFGAVTDEVLTAIESATARDVLERWILVAANAALFDDVVREMQLGERAFSIFGEHFNPLASLPNEVN